MNHRILAWLLKCYPSGWRSEYGAEMEDLLRREALSLSTICNVLCGALRERVRQPTTRFVILSVVVSAVLFALSVFCSQMLWRLVAAPVAQVLRDQRIDPPVLVATSPWEQALVIWLGIPLLFTLFAAYPFSLVFAYRAFVARRPLKPIAVCSAMLYTAGFAGGFAAWQFGSFGMLLRLLREAQNTSAVSVSQCFGLLAASTLGVAVTLQMPLVLLHPWDSNAERSSAN
jgi:Sec-independent protein secretion pathway component TatC